MPRDYQPFVIRVEELQAGGFPVEAEFQGTSWSATIPAALPLLSGQEVRQARSWLERGFIDRDYAVDFGSRLFRTLFQGPVREGFRMAYERVAPESGLRVVLDLPRVLADLPWELMYDAEGEHGFLARSSTAPLVRHFRGAPLPHRLPEGGPLRVLLVTASPPGYPAVSSEEEARAIDRSLAQRGTGIWQALRLLVRHLLNNRSLRGFVDRLRQRGQVEIDLLPHATRAELQRRMVASRNAGRDYHIVHFVGHGQVDQGGGQLLFEAERQGDQPGPGADLVNAGEFAELVAEPAVNLVVLNACQTALAASLFNGVAQATLQRGVPAVVGMQVPILDRAAVQFAREFYGAWAAGEPLEGALSYARRLITNETPGAAADWGIPVLYMAPIPGLTLNLGAQAPAIRWPWPLRSMWKALALFVSLLGVVSLLLTIPDINRQLRTRIPVIRCLVPYPMEGGSSFNVVVTRFSVVDDNGSTRSGGDGKALADYVFQNLQFNFDELELADRYDIRPPEHTCQLSGRSRADRESAAATLADRIDADIVVYGVITDSGGQAYFSPEFYVNHKGFEEGDEVTGQHAMGRGLLVALPFKAARFSSSDNPALSARTEALSLLTVGLAWYASDDFPPAIDYFEAAAQTKGWFDGAGKEVIHLLLGNAYVRLDSERHCTPQPETHLQEAQREYDEALRINPTYARAKVGQAGVLRQMAWQGVSGDAFQNIDVTLLDQSSAAYKAALDMDSAPESANIETKVRFGLGQVDYARFLRAFVLQGDWSTPMDRARAGFEQVIQEFGAGNDRVQNLAGHAHARLGLLAWQTRDYDLAAEHYMQAIGLVTPYYQAYYAARLGDVYVANGQTDRAIEAYDKAISTAELYGEAECHAVFVAKKKELLGGGP